MCKVTRSARTAVLSARQNHGQQGQLQQHPQVNPKVLVDFDEKFVVLPQVIDKNENNVSMQSEELSEQLVEEMVVVKEQSKDDSSSSSACASASSTAAHIHGHTPAAVDPFDNPNANASLRAISALCLPEQPNVLPGPIIRECLLGQVSVGSYPLGNNSFLPVVVKEFNLSQVLSKTTKQGHGLHEDALSELQIHAYIQKKKVRNVIELYAMHLNRSSNKLFAYLEYAKKGELFSLLQARSQGCTTNSNAAPLPLAVCGNLFVQLLHGIADLHAINVVHRDLSLENVLLSADNDVKICDFGLATICGPGVTINDGRVVGKVKYMCPEVYYTEEYDGRLADIWSAAVILFLLLTGVFPYERPSADDPRLVMLCHGQINELLAHWKREPLAEDILQVFENMFCPPQQRWQAQQLLKLPFCQRFANVPKETIAKAFAEDHTVNYPTNANVNAHDNASATNLHSHQEHSHGSLASSTDSGVDSPVSVQLESPFSPSSPALSASLTQSPSHSFSHCHSQLSGRSSPANNHPSHTLTGPVSVPVSVPVTVSVSRPGNLVNIANNAHSHSQSHSKSHSHFNAHSV